MPDDAVRVILFGPDGYRGIFINEEEAVHDAYGRYGRAFINVCRFEKLKWPFAPVAIESGI